MKIRKNDKVIVLTGKDKGKTGTVLRVYTAKNKVLVEGVNKVKKHVKPGSITKEGGIISIERSISAANVMYVDDKSGKPVKIGIKLSEGKKLRINRKTQEALNVK